MKVFISHKMSGIPEEEVTRIREEATSYLKSKYGDVEIIDNYHHSDAPENAGRLWHLGRSIQQLEEADAIYFCKDATLPRKYEEFTTPVNIHQTNGCLVEWNIAMLYKIKILE